MKLSLNIDINTTRGKLLLSAANNHDIYHISKEMIDAHGGEYKAIGRFIADPTLKARKRDRKLGTFIERPMFFLTDEDQHGYSVDDPGFPDHVIDQTYQQLLKLEHPQLNRFHRLVYYYALFQVIQDKQRPEFMGQLKIMRFGNQVMKMFGNKDYHIGPYNGVSPMNLLSGRNFVIDLHAIQLKNPPLPAINWTQCGFQAPSPVYIDGKPLTAYKSKISKSSAARFWEYMDCAPSLVQVMPRPWDKNTEQKVINSIRAMLGESAFKKLKLKRHFK